jgi:hypothetical protein
VIPQAYQLAPCCNDASQLYWLPEPRCNDVLPAASDVLQSNNDALQHNRNALLRSNDVLQFNRNALQYVFGEHTRG